MFTLTRIVAGALAAAGAICATLPVAEAGPTGAAQTCFHMNEVQNSKMSGFRILYLRAGARTFRMDFGADCNNLGSEPLVLHPFDNTGEICHAIDLDVSVRGTGERCIPTSLRRLTPDEVAAIPPADRP